MAVKIESKLYSARMESKVVSVPVPAIKGKARGTTVELEGDSSRYIFIPKIISSAIKNKTKEPAMAKSPMETPIMSKILWPTNKNTIMMASDTHDTLKACTSPMLCFKERITGMEPIISITANSTMVTFKISM